MTDKPDSTTHFGFETVREDEKAERVRGVFSSVASKYDIMNDVMSGGVHRIWKDAMMDWLAPRRGQRLLDVAGGTGDIAFRFLKRAGYGHATVLDLTESMLVEGRKRAEAERMAGSLDWVVGDAMALPFEANTFDVYTISFGIRKCHAPARRTDRGLSRPQAWWAIDGARVFAIAQSDDAGGLRRLFIQCDPANGADDRGRSRQLSISRRIDPQISRSGQFSGHDP